MPLLVRKGGGRGGEGTDCFMDNERACLFNFSNEVNLWVMDNDQSLRCVLWEAAPCEIKCQEGEKISFWKSKSYPVSCYATSGLSGDVQPSSWCWCSEVSS